MDFIKKKVRKLLLMELLLGKLMVLLLMEKNMENGQDIIIMGECFLYQIII